MQLTGIVHSGKCLLTTIQPLILGMSLYHNLSKYAHGDGLRSSSFMFTCSDPTMLLMSCACLGNNNKWCCLHLFVPPLAQCCFFGASCLTQPSMYYGINRWAYFRERKAAPFATTSFRKGWRAYFHKIKILEQRLSMCMLWHTTAVNMQRLIYVST